MSGTPSDKTALLKNNLEDPKYEDAKYPREQDYACAAHPDQPAFALCARCGKYLCHECSVVIESRSLCQDCLGEDEVFKSLLDGDKPTYAQTQSRADNALAIPKAAKSIRELPHAYHAMIKTGPLFYKTVTETPFYVSFIAAFLAFIPTTLYLVIAKLPSKIPEISQIYTETLSKSLGNEAAQQLVQQMSQQYASMGLVEQILLASFVAAMQILMLDAAYYISLRLIAGSKLTFAQSSSALHFCLTPFILLFLTAVWDYKIVGFVAFIIVTLKATTAMRITTQCSFLRGIFAMLAFIILMQFVI